MDNIIKNNKKLLYEEESYKLRGLFMKIYNELGPGLKESIYGNAFEELLKQEKIVYQREPIMLVQFGTKKVGSYRPDFLVYDKIIIELKSIPQIPRTHIQRVYQYLKSSKYKLGFVVNFGNPILQIIRRIFDLNQSIKSVAIRNNQRSEAGFTLVELLVAIAVFIILFSIVFGSFVKILHTQRVALALIAANSNAQLAIEQMAREMRTGKDFSESGEEISFTNTKGENVAYRRESAVGAIERSIDGGVNYKKITAENVKVSKLNFNLFTGSPDDIYPPRVTIIVQIGAPGILSEDSLINLQTTISSRSL